MIPYFGLEIIRLGQIEINVWGLLVALGISAAVIVSYFEAKRRKLDAEKILSLGFWTVLGALLGARLLSVIDAWSYYSNYPFDILKFWQGGMASFGGFAGGLLFLIIGSKFYRLNLLPHLDIVCFSLPLGFAIGRIGCFLTHLHKGALTNSFLGVRFPEGARYDLGIILAVFNLFIFLIFLIFHRKSQPTGFFIFMFLLFYGFGRFALDFLRAYDLTESDPRYYGLTLAQYGSIIMIVFGFLMGIKLFKTRTTEAITETNKT